MEVVRKCRLWFFLALLPLVATGCLRPGGASSAAQSYLAALKGSNYRKCYRMLAGEARAACSFRQFLRAIPLAPNVTQRWFAALTRTTDYMISGPARKDGTSITVSVEVRAPNLTLWQSQLAGLNGRALHEAVAAELRNDSYPKLVYRDRIVMVQRQRQWRLMADPSLHDRIAALRAAAVTAYHDYEFSRAVQLYHEALPLLRKFPLSGSEGTILSYRRELSRVVAALHNQPLAAAYLSRVRIAGVRRERTVGGRPGLFGFVTNLGPRPIDQLEIKITYYQRAGHRWREVYSEHHTALALPLGFVDFRPVPAPLGPHDKLRFGFALSAPPRVLADSRLSIVPEAVILSAGDGWPPKLAQTLRPLAIAADAPVTLSPLAGKTHSAASSHHGRRRHHRSYHHHRYRHYRHNHSRR